MDRTLYLIGEINHDMLTSFLPAFHALDSKKGAIRIILSSLGGEEWAGYAIYDAIRCSNNPVEITGYGAVYSMAALIFAAGDVRLLAPETRLMVHAGYYPLSRREAPTQEVIAAAKDAQATLDIYCKLLAKHTGAGLDVVKKVVAKETYYSAQEAVRFGYADGILHSKEDNEST